MVERVELRELEMELVAPFETSFGVQTKRRVLLVTVYADGLVGWGECTAGEDPFYSYETSAGCRQVLERYLVPALLEGRISGDPYRFYAESDFIRGNHMARAALETALWYLESLRRGVPLHQLFSGARTELFTGVSVGIQPSLDTLVDVVGRYIADGYRRIKIKIKPGWDVEPVARLKDAYPNMPLMVDANGAYSPGETGALEALDGYGLMMIEQPFHYADLVDHAALQQRLRTPICLDESIAGLAHARSALALGACRIINIKQGRVGGAGQAMAIHDLCAGHGIPVWAGGMLETGIGRALNIALATKENFSIPGDISASNRYWHRDIIEPEVVVTQDGTIAVPTKPGLGYEPVLSEIERLTKDRTVMKP